MPSSMPGTATAIASHKTRRSKCTAPRSDPISLSSEAMGRHAPVKRTAADAQRPGRVAHVPIEAGQCLLYERALGFAQRQFFEWLCTARAAFVQRKVGRAHDVAIREKNCSLDGMFQLSYVAGPEMIHEGLHRCRIESRELF